MLETAGSQIDKLSLGVLSVMPKFPEISREAKMGRFGPGGNFPEQVFHLQRWSSLSGRFGPTETCRSIFKNYRFQSHFTGK